MRTALRVGYPLAPSNPDLDYLLAQVAEAVQLTTTQYEKANGHYTAVGDWLAAPESPIVRFAPRMYAQGSMALETTVRPRGRVEHDLDFVCQVTGGRWTAPELYEAVYDRLNAHAIYRAMLKRKNRCLCLEYQGDFHLDIIPAISDPARGGTCVLVPDCKLEDWTPSNPKGYVGWFKSRSVTLLLEKRAKAMAEPLPAQRDADEKAPLAVAVQLVKRARDVMFNGADEAPRSIILTTLAGHHYTGGTCLATTIVEVLRGIREQIEAAAPQMIQIVNPTNAGEKFSDGLTADRYQGLREFASTLEAQITELMQLQGPRLHLALEKLFGEKPVSAALQKYALLEKGRRDAGTLTTSGAGIGVVAAPVAGIRVPRNTYFGD